MVTGKTVSVPQLGLELPGPPFASMRSAVEAAQMAEAAGFDAVFASDDMGDALACAGAVSLATQRIKVGTSIAVIYLRHPKVTGAAASAINDLSGGRMILGLGVGGRRLDDVWAIPWRRPLSAVRDYVARLTASLPGDRVPAVYLAARGPRMAKLAGSLADGVIFHLLSPDRLRYAIEAVREGEEEASRSPGSVTIALALNALVGDDLAAGRNAARNLFSFYVQMGYARDIIQSETGLAGGMALPEAITDDLVDDLALVGPPARCRRQLQELYDLGVELPILSPVAPGWEWQAGLRMVLETFRRPAVSGPGL